MLEPNGSRSPLKSVDKTLEATETKKEKNIRESLLWTNRLSLEASDAFIFTTQNNKMKNTNVEKET